MDRDRELRGLLDRQAITDVLHRYCRNVDLFRADKIAELFTDDCVVDYGPGQGGAIHGAAQLEAGLRSRAGLKRFSATSHHVSNIQIDFTDDDHASSVCYLYAWHAWTDSSRPDAYLWGQYHDRVVRRDNGWLIASRHLILAGQRDFPIEWDWIGRTSVD
ncbi:MAG: nuclear transport factor 2 family protein [Ilumatobacteraceae bacterium]